jgi:glycosyltransferase involved in cell wall biosynthesis
MRLLIIHQNFPGQFRHMAAEWAARPGNEVIAIGRDTAPGLPEVPGIKMLRYKPHRPVHANQHHYLCKMEDAVLHGQAVARVLLDLKRQGFKPDAILAHPGWGETLYAKDVFPGARLVHFSEWFYNSQGADIGFDPEFPVTFDDQARIRSWNALHLLNLENCDAAISPTLWQKAQHPLAYRDKITVAHEGIDTQNLWPDSTARFKLPNGQILKAGDPVVTYVARNLEPYRGFHSFMRALPAIQAEHKQCHTVIVGGDEVSYGSRPKCGKFRTWREKMLAEVGSKLDPARTHFVGKLPYADYKRLLQVSGAHVYLTYPFVLSWSMLEACASGCLVIGSDTAPVAEVLRDGENGRLVGFSDVKGIAASALAAITEPINVTQMRRTAQSYAQSHFSRLSGLERFANLVKIQKTEAICVVTAAQPNGQQNHREKSTEVYESKFLAGTM